MYTTHDGEVLLKEKYGSTALKRSYVKPPEQSGIVIVDEDKLSDVASWFVSLFLPQGYPESVSKDYIAYQIWDTAQAFCSTITGTIATQEVLRGVGVGDKSATPLAATVTWVIKDGCGHVGRILFAFSHGTSLDAYSKKWRLYADTLNDAAMCLEIALPLFKHYTTLALCVSTVMKAIVGVAGGATRVAMTQHHAVRGNLADVAAKDSAQETAVNLVASFTALFIITIFGNSITIFIIMTVLHIACNYMAVRAVCLRTLNEPRFLQVIDMYLRQEVIAAPCEINRKEPIVFYQMGPNLLDLKLCGFRIRLGYSIKKLISQNHDAAYLRDIMEVYNERKYVLVPNTNLRKMYILIKEDADPNSVLCAYFHAVLLSIITCAINDHPSAVYESCEDVRPFAKVCQLLQSAEWTREATRSSITYSGFQYEASKELSIFIDEFVQKEWIRVREGLEQVGWDLSKHLLMVDEWRVYSQHIIHEVPVMKQRHISSIGHMNFQTMPFSDIITELEKDESIDKKIFTIEPEPPLSSSLQLETVDDIQGTSVSSESSSSNLQVVKKQDSKLDLNIEPSEELDSKDKSTQTQDPNSASRLKISSYSSTLNTAEKQD